MVTRTGQLPAVDHTARPGKTSQTIVSTIGGTIPDLNCMCRGFG